MPAASRLGVGLALSSVEVVAEAEGEVLETGEDQFDGVPALRARFAAERVVPEYTAAFVHEHGLDVVVEDGDRRLVRD